MQKYFIYFIYWLTGDKMVDRKKTMKLLPLCFNSLFDKVNHMELEYKINIIDQFQKKTETLQTLQITALLQNEYLPIAPLCLQICFPYRRFSGLDQTA